MASNPPCRRSARLRRNPGPGELADDTISVGSSSGDTDSDDDSSVDELSLSSYDEFDDGRRQIMESILGIDGTIAAVQGDGELVSRPIGPDLNIVMDALEKFDREEINNKQLKQVLCHWCTAEEYSALDNMFPSEDEVKEEKEDIAFNEDLAERVEAKEEEIDDEEDMAEFMVTCQTLGKELERLDSEEYLDSEVLEELDKIKRKRKRRSGDGGGKARKKKRCSEEGCTNEAKKGGVCIRHGAKVKLCSSEGCTNNAQKGGVCIKHGAQVKLCSSEGCTNNAKKGGVCIKHGAKSKLCSSEGCTNNAQKGGVCKRHGAKVTRKLCSSEGCSNIAQKGGVCKRHGAKVKQCQKIKRGKEEENNEEGESNKKRTQKKK